MLYWISVNYEITEDEDFETVKTRVISDFESYLKFLNGKSEESLKKVIKSFTFSKLIGEKLCNGEDLKNLSKEIRHQIQDRNS
ncbi:Uncharacterised protein [Streptococcus pneumoniae]|uniref:hypothetical protein n=1 Tax=Streptococcus pneumoniae TaxID=1313 RepID=UPI0005E7CA19|nr:hypothetical protein [Streptococcus pneumoniae]CIQ69797.1 Uncharacterised protein [Streptococcus pneumoniae]CJM45523.1 Uncharacterised protein [Streptococcus pneumoniae]COB26482.1 Uncharacterised protein [Streptococcus pneumoniae]COC37906.1 Uncharacterised protein [Streptococcus pneumoniae]COO33906.1 Uncharacterised protein [Streptococcus pneumoniae]